MDKKLLLLLIFVAILLYPIYNLFQIVGISEEPGSLDQVRKAVTNYQVSIWISWVIMVSISVYYKWTEKSNFFFQLTYGIIIIGFIIFGVYYQQMVNEFDLSSRFMDGHTLGVLTAAQNVLVAGILTGFLQAAVWWFTRRWHRR